MNKTLITLGFLILIGGAIVGNVILAIYRPEQLATFNGSIVTILGVGTAGIVTIYGLGKQGQQLEQIKTNTNGNLTRLQSENERLTNVIIEAGLEPETPGGRGEHVA